ncbi:MAG: MerR family transcriptional regulator [Bacteroidales bacterium]
MANYSIKDLENFTGIKAHTIRIWEKRYNVVEPKRTETNIRYYDDEDLKKLLNVSILNRHGYKISNIVEFSNSSITDKILNLAQSNSNAESQIENLVVSMIEMDENKFDKIFNTSIINLGFEETILKLIYPFFEKIGILWQLGTINPAQEHFISNLIRQKLIVAIDGLVTNVNQKSKCFVLYLPEGEFHELGLIFYQYLIKKRNHKLYYLGQTVPVEALKEVLMLKEVDYLFTSIITPMNDDKMECHFNELLKTTENIKKIFLSGHAAEEAANKDLPDKFHIIKSALEFRTILDSL